MRRYQHALLLLALVASTSWAKGNTEAIEIVGDGLKTPVTITDQAIVDAFSIWNGPCAGFVPMDGSAPPPPQHDPKSFVDWLRGPVTERPTRLPRFEVKFLVKVPNGAARRFIVAYEFDPKTGEGYFFPPTSSNDLIYYGVEGHWVYASRQWNKLIQPVIDKNTVDRAERDDRKLTCKQNGKTCWPDRSAATPPPPPEITKAMLTDTCPV